jgi:hypothetical protein
VLVELCVLREDDEFAMGLFREFLFLLPAASVDEVPEEAEGCL